MSFFDTLFPNGVFGIKGVRRERGLTDQLISGLNAGDDSELQAMLQAGQEPMTVEQHQQYRAQLMGLALDHQTVRSNTEKINNQLDALRAQASSPEDLAQLDALRTTAGIAHDSLLSGNKDVQQMGANAMSKVLEGVQAYTTQNEAQRIAADNLQAQQQRELGNTEFTRLQSIQKDHLTESAPFVQVKQGYQAVQALAQQAPTPQTDQALMMAALRVINPNVLVRSGTDPGDEYWNALPGGIGQLAKYVVTGGASMLPEERQALLNVVQARAVQENADQADRNTRAVDLGTAAGLPDKYLNALALPLIPVGTPPQQVRPPVPAAEQGAPGAQPQPAPITSNAEKAGQTVGAAIVDSVVGLGKGIGEPAGQWVGNAIRNAAGRQSYTDPTTGETYTRVDLGNGRAEWRSSRPRNTDEF